MWQVGSTEVKMQEGSLTQFPLSKRLHTWLWEFRAWSKKELWGDEVGRDILSSQRADGKVSGSEKVCHSKESLVLTLVKEGPWLRVWNINLRTTKGFLAEEREDKVWALAAIWRKVGEVWGWEGKGWSGGKAWVIVTQVATMAVNPRLFFLFLKFFLKKLLKFL